MRSIKIFLSLCLIVMMLAPSALAQEPAPGEGAYDGTYWTTPMDIRDEEAVWNMLMSPMTVVRGDPMDQVLLLSAPNPDSAPVGEVTCATQGVHVLERTGDGWVKVEAYSSSFFNSRTKQWNALVQGYIQESQLTEAAPADHMGLVVDKLTQRLYVFMDGHLYSTLRVSTGLPNERQPYNETRSGEFFLVSKVGDFKSDNMTCEMALRFNSGDLLHQVPYIGSSKDYDICESKLGTRASHGCIRVQRKRTPEGVNMKWIWEHYKKNTRLVIWEDVDSRAVETTPQDAVVYYNPKGGKNYHLKDFCYGVKKDYLPLKQLTYVDLFTDKYKKLTPCPYCNPPEK